MSDITITVTLDETKANLILAGLGELPARASFDLILEIRAQWQRAQADAQAEMGAPDDPA